MSNLTRASFEELWERLDAEERAQKLSNETMRRLQLFYRDCDDVDRRVMDEVLTAWVLEDDERRRFDALALIEDCEIRFALPALETALARLEHATGPSVPFDRAKLERIITRLEGAYDT